MSGQENFEEVEAKLIQQYNQIGTKLKFVEKIIDAQQKIAEIAEFADDETSKRTKAYYQKVIDENKQRLGFYKQTFC